MLTLSFTNITITENHFLEITLNFERGDTLSGNIFFTN